MKLRIVYHSLCTVQKSTSTPICTNERFFKIGTLPAGTPPSICGLSPSPSTTQPPAFSLFAHLTARGKIRWALFKKKFPGEKKGEGCANIAYKAMQAKIGEKLRIPESI